MCSWYIHLMLSLFLFLIYVRSLNVWLRHLEEHIQSSSYGAIGQQQSFFTERQQQQQQLPQQQTTIGTKSCNNNTDNTTMISSGSSTSSSSSSSSSASCSSASTASVSSSIGSIASSRNADWQTIAPPSKHHQHQHHHQQQQQAQLQMQQLHPKPPLHDWSSVIAGQSLGAGVVGMGGSVADKLCDNLNGITLNELASSQNSLGLTIGGGGHHTGAIFSESSLVNGVVAAAAVSQHTAPNIFGTNAHPIINIINNNNNSCTSNLNNDDHDTSFSKNGTEILDFEPTPSNPLGSCDSCISSNPIPSGQPQQLSQREVNLGLLSYSGNGINSYIRSSNAKNRH